MRAAASAPSPDGGRAAQLEEAPPTHRCGRSRPPAHRGVAAAGLGGTGDHGSVCHPARRERGARRLGAPGLFDRYGPGMGRVDHPPLAEGVFHVAVHLARFGIPGKAVERDALIGDLALPARPGDGAEVAHARADRARLAPSEDDGRPVPRALARAGALVPRVTCETVDGPAARDGQDGAPAVGLLDDDGRR